MSELSKFITKPTYQKIKLLDGKSVGIRKWLLAEEKDFLFNIESRRTQVEDESTTLSETDVMVEESVNLAKRCLDKPNIIGSMSSDNLIYLLSELRKISKGDAIEFTFHCMNVDCPDFVEYPPELQESSGIKGKSRTPFEDVINLNSKDVVIKRFNDSPIEIGDFKYHIQDLSYSTQRKLDDKYLKKLLLNKWNYNFVLESIIAIEPIGDKKITDFSKKELSEFLDNNLDADEFKKLSDSISDQSSDFSINKKVTCPMCQRETDIVYDELFSLMVF